MLDLLQIMTYDDALLISDYSLAATFISWDSFFSTEFESILLTCAIKWKWVNFFQAALWFDLVLVKGVSLVSTVSSVSSAQIQAVSSPRARSYHTIPVLSSQCLIWVTIVGLVWAKIWLKRQIGWFRIFSIPHFHLWLIGKWLGGLAKCIFQMLSLSGFIVYLSFPRLILLSGIYNNFVF